ncbi:hypothetical protein C8R44DRAFT_893337 [Mycena epipterygia]|nr:hypothetical protein C8R44DRAFT_893337 [Mycena epipterygia]
MRKPPSTTRPVTRVVHRGYVASEDIPPEPLFITHTEPLRATLAPHACTAIPHINTQFLFHTSTTFSGPFSYFLLHPYTPFPGLPTQISVYQTRTPFCDTVTFNLKSPHRPNVVVDHSSSLTPHRYAGWILPRQNSGILNVLLVLKLERFCLLACTWLHS